MFKYKYNSINKEHRKALESLEHQIFIQEIRLDTLTRSSCLREKELRSITEAVAAISKKVHSKAPKKTVERKRRAKAPAKRGKVTKTSAKKSVKKTKEKKR